MKRVLLLLLMVISTLYASAQRVDYKILQPYDRVYYNSNRPTVEIMAYAGNYYNSHGQIECTIKERDEVLYNFTQNFMAAMGDSAKLTFSFNLEPGFYKIELREGQKLVNECMLGYEPELIGLQKEQAEENDGIGGEEFKSYWREKISELATYPQLTQVKKIKKLSRGGRDIYHVLINSYGGRTLEGYYAVPKERGFYKAVVKVAKRADSLNLEAVVADTISQRALFVANVEESIDVVRLLDFIQGREEISLVNVFVEGSGAAGAYAMTAAAIDSRIAAVSLFAPVRKDYIGIDTPIYANLSIVAKYLKIPLLYGVDINGLVADPYNSFELYNKIDCNKTYYIFLENNEPPIWEELKINFYNKHGR